MERKLAQSELENFPSLTWSQIAPCLTTAARAALEAVMTSLDGRLLTREQALLLAKAEGDDLLGLLVAADLVRGDQQA